MTTPRLTAVEAVLSAHLDCGDLDKARDILDRLADADTLPRMEFLTSFYNRYNALRKMQKHAP